MEHPEFPHVPYTARADDAKRRWVTIDAPAQFTQTLKDGDVGAAFFKIVGKDGAIFVQIPHRQLQLALAKGWPNALSADALWAMPQT
jgi:hypothetical protein